MLYGLQCALLVAFHDKRRLSLYKACYAVKQVRVLWYSMYHVAHQTQSWSLPSTCTFACQVLFVLLAGGGVTAWWLYGAREEQRDALRSAVAAAVAAAGPTLRSAGRALSHAAAGLRERIDAALGRAGRVGGRSLAPPDETDLGYFQPLTEHEVGPDPGFFTLK